MEILAENRFFLTKSLFYEGMARISRDSYGKTAMKYTLVILMVWAISAGLLLCFGGSLSQSMIYLLPVTAICLWINLWAPRTRIKKAWLALVSRCGRDPERITRFYEDHVEIHAGGLVKSIPYSDILEVKQSKRLLVLICADKVGVMVSKSGFTHGKTEEVLALVEGA